MNEILLSSTRESWQKSPHHCSENDGTKIVKELRPKVLSRDGYKCHFCEFTSQKWQEVHHLNDDHDDWSMSNLTTACPLCHQCYHLSGAGSSGGGKLIWLPELTQVELHHLCRAIFVASFGDDDSQIASSARSIFATLESRHQFMEQQFATGASDPALLGQVFLAMKNDEYEKRVGFLKNIRLLPMPGRFDNQVKYWRDVVYRDIPPSTWGEMIKSYGSFAIEGA